MVLSQWLYSVFEETKMQPGERDPKGFRALRQRMKRVLRRINPNRSIATDERVPANTQQLLYRLHLAQVEVEKKNEELRRTQLALESSQNRFVDLLEYTSALYNLAPVGYLTLTVGGIIVEANLTAVELLGVRRELLLKQPIMAFIVADDHDLFDRYCTQLQRTQHAQRCEVRMVRSDGSQFFVQMDATITGDMPDGAAIGDRQNRERFVRLTISDISARVQLEEEERKVRTQLEATLHDLHQTQAQLLQQERLAVVGQLAAGIAHDFNNILAAITLYSELVMRAPDLPAPLHKRVEAIVTQANRATLLIQQILDFSRRTAITRQPTALSGFMQQLLELLQDTLPETIQVSLEIKALQPGIDDVVEMDAARIQQVLLNLALNARDAMPNGGELRFTLSRIMADGNLPVVASGSLPAGPWLRIDVSDSGMGIQPGDLPRLFEPFFTTKSIGQGSGLGLSQVWGIVTHHEGEIDVTSEVGKGTTFSLYLPASSAE
jgi:PAS domain S-box-containing protein